MAGLLVDASAATLRTRGKPALRGTLFDVDLGYAQFVDVGAVVVLGIGNGRLERLLDDSGGLLLREGQDVERLVDRLAAHQVRDQPALLRRKPGAADRCCGFHRQAPYCFFGATEVLRSAAWPLKVRVIANSPSLWPTICSVTYTGTCCLPLCTATVRPMKSGRIVERRDHVRIGLLSLLVCAESIFFCRWASTNGPFFSERDMDAPTSCTGAGRSSGRFACSCACDSPWRVDPTG